MWYTGGVGQHYTADEWRSAEQGASVYPHFTGVLLADPAYSYLRTATCQVCTGRTASNTTVVPQLQGEHHGGVLSDKCATS